MPNIQLLAQDKPFEEIYFMLKKNGQINHDLVKHNLSHCTMYIHLWTITAKLPSHRGWVFNPLTTKIIILCSCELLKVISLSLKQSRMRRFVYTNTQLIAPTVNFICLCTKTRLTALTENSICLCIFFNLPVKIYTVIDSFYIFKI